MKSMFLIFTAVLVLGLSSLAGATTYDFSGTINYNTDVGYYNFSLTNDAADVRIWTDSWRPDGVNLDSVMHIWTSSGNLIAMNDDNPDLITLDSAILLADLAVGNYICTIGTYNNFARGTTLAEGFVYDGTTPIPIGDFSDSIVFNPNDTGYYHVNFEGVDTVAPVPEPGTIVLLGFGVAGLAIYGKRRSNLREA